MQKREGVHLAVKIKNKIHSSRSKYYIFRTESGANEDGIECE